MVHGCTYCVLEVGIVMSLLVIVVGFHKEKYVLYAIYMIHTKGIQVGPLLCYRTLQSIIGCRWPLV